MSDVEGENSELLARHRRNRSSEQLEKDRERAYLNLDLQDRMVQATFELAKKSFEHAKYKKTCWYEFEKRLLQNCPSWMQKRMQGPNLFDFKRAYSLIHNWYPKLQETRDHLQTWTDCKRKVLESMHDLLERDIITVDHDDNDDDDTTKDKNDAFKKWAKDMLEECKDIKRPEESTEMDQEFSCFQQDPKVGIVQQNLQSMHALLSGAEASTFASYSERLLSMKAPVLRWLWIFLMLDLLFLFEAAALGFLTQIFFEMTVDVETASQGGKTFNQLRHLWLLLLPAFVLVYSILGTELAQLTHDAVHFPPFKNARASLIIMWTRAPTKTVLDGKIVRRPIRIIDFCLSDGLLLFMLIGATIFYFFWDEPDNEASSMDLILDGINAGALLWACFCFAVVGASHIYCYVWLTRKFGSKLSKRDESEGAETNLADVKFRPTRCARVLHNAIDEYGIFPGATWKYFLPMQRFLEIHKHEDTVWQDEYIPEWLKQSSGPEGPEGPVDWEAYSEKLAANDSFLRRENNKWGRLFAGASAIIWLVIAIICWCLDTSHRMQAKGMLITANVGLAIAIALAALATEMLIPQIRDNKSFRFHAVLFLVCIGLFSFATFELAIPPENLTAMMTNRTGASGERGIFYNDGSSPNMVTPYPVCSMTWGSSEANVRLLDLAAMSYYAYVPSKTAFEQLLSESFGSIATNVYFTEFKELPRVVASRFCGSGKGTETCTIIVAVKGTSTKLEVMADLGIFSTVTILQVLDKIGPLMGTLPQHIISLFLEMVRLPFLRKTQHHVVETLSKTVQELQKNYTNDKLVITGHSLGGSFAEVAGARLRLPAVGFSAPGHFYMMRSFKMTRESITQNLVTIIPSLDPVPQLASHLDVVQRILCRGQDGEYRQPLACHSIEITTCELWRVCGDKRLRNFSNTCLEPLAAGKEILVNNDCIGQSYNSSEGAKCKAR